jgi:protein required for attachment to host cells
MTRPPPAVTISRLAQRREGMMTVKKSVVWVVVMDGEHARVVAPTPSHGQFATTLALDSATAHLRSQDIGTDRPGRSFESASPTRHTIAPRQDLHQAAKHDFVLEVAGQLNEHAIAGDFDHLVLVAPGHALHDLRAALGAAADAKVVGTLVKDLTKTPDSALASHLAEWWQKPAGEPA